MADVHPGAHSDDGWAPPQLDLPLSRVQLDDLLAELLDRVGEVMSSRERLSALLQAVVAIGSNLDLHSTLQRIIRAACQLVDARYGALGVIGPSGDLIDFITDGVTAAEHEAIGALPTGRGVLGLLIDEPHSVRMPNIADHPRSFGFPPNHPIMHSFLGVPVRIRDQVFGNLYLTEKRGAAEFSEDDEEIVTALAAAAGVAIDNARLYEAAAQRQRWLEATTEILESLTGPVGQIDALRLIADRARAIADATIVMVLIEDPAAGALRVEVTSPDDKSLEGCVIDAKGTPLAEVIESRNHVISERLDLAAAWPTPIATGPTLMVPLPMTEQIAGILVVAVPPDSHGFEVIGNVNMISAFATQAALALDRARAQEEREQLMVLEDRERIARDLHDVVIQRLFATGLSLQSMSRLVTRDEVRRRVEQAVDDLDVTIRNIRTSIFELRTPLSGSLRAEINAATRAAAESMGFQPTLTIDGPVDTVTPDDIQATVVAVLSEALSNIARHARATSATISLSAGHGRLSLTVADNGVGMASPEAGGSGLANMRSRAQDLGGDCTVTAAQPHGAVVSWWAPLTPSGAVP